MLLSLHIIVTTRFDNPSNHRSVMSSSKQHWSAVICMSARCQLFCLLVKSPADTTRHIISYFDCYKLANARINISGSNEVLTIKLHSYDPSWAFYFTRRRSPGIIESRRQCSDQMICYLPHSSDVAYLEVECKGRVRYHAQLIPAIVQKLLEALERKLLCLSGGQERDEEGRISGEKHHGCEI